MYELAVACPDEDSTIKVAEKVAQQLVGGELIELVGDVGSGKTVFAKGLAKGLGSKDKVSSPSFALKNVYKGRLNLHHFDLYRLEEPGLIRHEIKDSLKEKDSATVIEWAEAVVGKLPKARIKVSFLTTGEKSRKLKISYPKQES